MRTHGFIDKTGNMAIELPGEPHGNSYYDRPRFSGGVAAVHLGDGEWGYVDRTGEVVMRGLESAGHLYEGLAAVQLNGKWGYINSAGQWVIEPQFDRARRFSEGLAWVVRYRQEGDPANIVGVKRPCIGGTWYCIDRKGEAVISPRGIGYVEGFSDGLACVLVGEKIGYIDRAGNMAIPPRFERAGDFSNGVALVVRMCRSAPGLGSIVPLLWFLDPRSPHYHRDYGYIDKTGEFIRGFEPDYAGIFWSRYQMPP